MVLYGPPSASVPQRALHVYHQSKAEAEKVVRRAVEKGLAAVILRLSNVYGSPKDHAAGGQDGLNLFSFFFGENWDLFDD